MGNKLADDVNRTPRIYSKLPVDILFFSKLQRPVGTHSRIVDHHINPAESGDRLICSRLNLIHLRYIQLEQLHILILLKLLFLFRCTHCRSYIPTQPGKMYCSQPSQSGACSSNKNCLISHYNILLNH
ncbi:hypothetical protein D3C75_951380 [compost metagenome]